MVFPLWEWLQLNTCAAGWDVRICSAAVNMVCVASLAHPGRQLGLKKQLTASLG